MTNKKKSVSKQIFINHNVCIVAYDGENWIRVHCRLVDDSNNNEAKQAFIDEFEWAKEEGYTLDNPDFQILYLTDAVSTLYDIEGVSLATYTF